MAAIGPERRVFHKDKATPLARIAKVTINDQLAGNLSHPIKSATKILTR